MLVTGRINVQKGTLSVPWEDGRDMPIVSAHAGGDYPTIVVKWQGRSAWSRRGETSYYGTHFKTFRIVQNDSGRELDADEIRLETMIDIPLRGTDDSVKHFLAHVARRQQEASETLDNG